MAKKKGPRLEPGAKTKLPSQAKNIAQTVPADKGSPCTHAEALDLMVDALDGQREGKSWRLRCPLCTGHAVIANLDADILKLFCHACGKDRQSELIDWFKANGMWCSPPSVLVPVPDDAPRLDLRSWEARLGKAEYVWPYRDAKKRLLCTVVRFAKKQIRPFTYWSAPGWLMKGLPGETLPLYGQDRLAENPDARVLVFEGEKTADAAQTMFPDCVCMSWMRGTSGASIADCSPLKSRDVVVCSDNDDVGRAAAEEFAQRCAQAGAASVRTVQWPPGLPEGWDVADEVPEGVDIATAIADAKPYVAGGDAEDNPFTRFIWVMAPNAFFDVVSRKLRDAGQLNNKYAAVPGFKKGVVRKLLGEPRFPKVDEMTYAPGADIPFTVEGGVRKLNTWLPNPIEAASGDVQPMLDHIAYLFPDKTHQEMVLWWMAVQVQRPGVKIHWALVIVGPQGTGKTTIFEFMARVLGEANTTTINAKELKKDFNGFMQSVQLLLVEEILQEGRLESANNLKVLITGRTIWINQKFINSFEQPNRTNILLTSNFAEKAVALETTDRRHAVLKTTEDIKPTEYYDRLYPWMDVEANIAAMLYHLKHKVDISKYSPKGHAPMTDAKREMAKASRHPAEEWLQRKFEDEEHPLAKDLVNIGHVLECTPFKFREHDLQNYLRSLGGMALERQPRLADKSRPRLWAIRNVAEWKGATEAQLAAAYDRPLRDGKYESWSIGERKRQETPPAESAAPKNTKREKKPAF